MNSCDYFEIMISAFLDGELDSAESDELRAHLMVCEHCREYAAATALVSKTLRESEEDVPEGFTEGVMSKVALEDGVQLRGKPRLFAFGRYTTIAAILVVVILAAASGPFRSFIGANENDLVMSGAGGSDGGSLYTADSAEPHDEPEGSDDQAAGNEDKPVASGADTIPSSDADYRMPDSEAGSLQADMSLSAEPEYGAPALPYGDTFYAILVISGDIPELLLDYSYEDGAESERYYLLPAEVIDQLWTEYGGIEGWHIYREEPNTDQKETTGIAVVYG